jgi:hypothetical protein
VSSSRDAAVEEIQALLESARQLRTDLRARETAYRQAARMIEKGVALDEVMEASGARTARQELTDAMAEFERHRHSTRLAMTATGLEEGMSIGQIGRAWGFSRQLAARYAQEVRDRS